MAVDTRNKRFAMMGLALPFLRVLPTPDGSFNAADRQQLLFCYPGIAFAAPPAIFAQYTGTHAYREVYEGTHTERESYTATVEC